MGWSKVPDAPAWGGKYEILNILNYAAREYHRDGTVKIFGTSSLGCMGIVSLMLASALGSFGGVVGIFGALLIAGAIWAYYYSNKEANREIWLGDYWTLVIDAAGVHYRRASNAIPPVTARPEWSVPLDAVASVETTQTKQYTPRRDYGGRNNEDDFRSIPEHEWQVFLFLNDGTRRPLYFANSARDDCAALAASIREYLNAAAPVAAPSAPDGSRPSAFDL